MSADRCKQCRLKAESHYDSAYEAFASLSDSSSLELLKVQLERVALCEHQLASKTNIFSVCFIDHFPGGSGLADTRMSPFSILVALRMTEVVVTIWTIRCAKLQSNRHYQQTNTQLFIDQMPFLSPTNSVRELKGNKTNIAVYNSVLSASTKCAVLFLMFWNIDYTPCSY